MDSFYLAETLKYLFLLFEEVILVCMLYSYTYFVYFHVCFIYIFLYICVFIYAFIYIFVDICIHFFFFRFFLHLLQFF
jgi:hypothetical protein